MTIKLSKLFFAAILIYYGWFQAVLFQIPFMLPILGAAMIGFIVLNALLTGTGLTRLITFELAMWILFAVTSLVFGYFVAENIGFLVSEVYNLFEYLMLIYAIIYIADKDGNLDFFIKTFIIFALICALTAVFAGVEYEPGRISMGLTDNPNGLGVNMAIGICCILYKVEFKKFLYSVAALGSILLFTYVIVLTGSRKSFLGIVIIVAYWLVFVAFKDTEGLSFAQKLKGFVLIGAAGAAAYSTLYVFFSSSVLLERLITLFQSGSDTRTDMYDAAFRLFRESPLVGVGFNNFRAVAGFDTYSHSTYAEAIACTGIIGSFLYFLPYVTMLFHYVKMAFSRNAGHSLIKQERVMLGLFGLMVFLGIGIIHFYELTSSIAFGMIFAFHFVNKKIFAKE
jgi:O-antigen ligase